MNQLYVLIIYIVHNGSINEGGIPPIADLYGSQQSCERALQSLQPVKAPSKAACAPISAIDPKELKQITKDLLGE